MLAPFQKRGTPRGEADKHLCRDPGEAEAAHEEVLWAFSSAHMHNLYLGAHCFQQMFAGSPKELERVRSHLSFLSCF